MRSRIELIAAVKQSLTLLVSNDTDYQPYADKINLTIDYFEKRISSADEEKTSSADDDKLTSVVEDFRVWLNDITSKAAEKSSRRPSFFDTLAFKFHTFFKTRQVPFNKDVRLVSTPAFQTVIYQALLIAAMVKPINDEDSITQTELKELSSDNVLYVSHGHFFELENLVKWIKKKGVMKNFINNLRFHPQDELAIIKLAATRFNIDLKNLKPEEYKVELHPSLISEAISIAQQSFAPSAEEINISIAYGSESAIELSNSEMNAIVELSTHTNLPIERIVILHTQYPAHFIRLQTASLYIFGRLSSVADAIRMTDEESELLRVLTDTHGVRKFNLAALEYVRKELIQPALIKNFTSSQLEYLSELTQINGVVANNIDSVRTDVVTQSFRSSLS